jgi:membrane protein
LEITPLKSQLLNFKIRLTRKITANPFRFLAFLGHRFIEDRCLQHASALAYTTLLSLVPLMAVTFSIFTAFPVFVNLRDGFQDFLFQNFVPTSAELLKTYLLEFAQKASRLTAIGIGGLIMTSVLLMASIDNALNAIWRVETPRPAVIKFLVYWAVLTLSPLLIGISLAISSYIFSLPLLSETAGNTHLLRVTPFIMSSIAFALLYMIVPNQRVSIQPAIVGGLLAALLFELAKKIFAFYITQFPTYQAIYGALAILPIFLVWIYVCWIIVLLGAELTHCLLSYYEPKTEQTKKNYSEYSEQFYDSFRLLGHLWTAQGTGHGLTLEQLEKKEPHLTRENIEYLLKKLNHIQLIHLTVHQHWVLTQDLSRFTLYQLLTAGQFILPITPLEDPRNDQWQQQFSHILTHSNQQLKQKMTIHIADLLKSNPDLNRATIHAARNGIVSNGNDYDKSDLPI